MCQLSAIIQGQLWCPGEGKRCRTYNTFKIFYILCFYWVNEHNHEFHGSFCNPQLQICLRQRLADTHRHHQTLGFFPGEASPGLYCSCLHLLLVLGALCLQFCLQQGKGSLAQVIDVAVAKLSPFFFCLKIKSLGLISKFALGHCPSALSSTLWWVVKNLPETEQVISPGALHNSSYRVCQQLHHQ